MQVVVTPGKKGKVTTEEMSLVEVGPRVCLQPIKIFAGSFGGPVLYENPGYVSPNKVSDAPDRCWTLSISSILPAQACRAAYSPARQRKQTQPGPVCLHVNYLKLSVNFMHYCWRRSGLQSRSRALGNTVRR